MALRGRDIVERFVLKNGSRQIEVDAVIDTGSQQSAIPKRIADELTLVPFTSESPTIDNDPHHLRGRYSVLMGWVPYAERGYQSQLEVGEWGRDEVLVGMDFLLRFELSVDFHHHGLVGFAPVGAVPLLDGGYVVNPPTGFVRRRNLETFESAPKGKIFLPHPAFRFTTPSGFKG